MTDQLVLSILWWTDESPLEATVERDERRSYSRSDPREDWRPPERLVCDLEF